MKATLVAWLCCPECQGGLTLEAWRVQEEIEDGELQCEGCRRTYPIINGIPRMLPDALAAQTLAYHAEFFQTYAQRTEAFRARAGQPAAVSRWWADETRTIRSYSYQWRKFKEMFPHWEQVFRESIAPVPPSFFQGRTGLDGGCGFGRSLVYAASYGATMIGLDLSEAIEAARANTGELPAVHLVQGDIFHPPVRRHSLDFVYSIGVLHHLPDPKAGFLSLSRLLKPGAPMIIWVYLRGRGRQIAAFTVMRAVSTRLPLRILNVACLLLAVGQWLLFVGPRRLLELLGLHGVASRIPFSFYARYPFRTLHTDWFDGLSVPLVSYYKPHEIEAWYREGGFDPIQIDPEARWNGRALGYAPSPVEPTAARS
jgi:uncharacterized protein YbaR (Trm112 family)/SAM-dependent methyltransferase